MSDDVVTLCDKCGQEMGTGHALLETDCILGHDDHVDRYVGFLCRRHYHWTDRTLVQIEELFALIDNVRQPKVGEAGRTATRVGSPAPGRVEVMALTDHRGVHEWIDDNDAIPDLLGALETWVLIVEEETGKPMRPTRRQTLMPRCAPLRPDPTLTATYAQRLACTHASCASTQPLDPPTLTELVRYLRHYGHYVAQQAWVDEYVADLQALHRHVARSVGDTMWPKPIGRCPNCRTDLFNTIGIDSVTCRRCNTTWAGVHLARLRLIFEQEAKSA